jgi:enoyl-CoA hydratase
MPYRNLLLEVTDRVAILTIHRPDKLNALDHATVEEIGAAAAQIATDEEVAALIITGSGPKAFVAGADIGELAKLDPAAARRTSRRGQSVLNALEAMPKPVIAAVNGFALGGGLELALACHLRVVAENAVLGLPEVSLGIIPGYGGTQRLARLIGPGRALDLILTGRKVKAAEALEMGLANRGVAAGEAVAAARELAGQILANGPLAVAFALQAVREGLESPQDQGQSLEAALFGLLAATADTREGLQAFLEKRRAEFKGR